VNEALQRAIDNLQILDVYLRSAEAELLDGFEPKYDSEADTLQVYFKHLVTRSDVLELKDGDDIQKLFRVYIELGARWTAPASEDEKQGLDEKARVEGIMVAEYRILQDPGQEALEMFAMRNASYHVWPYWREYLSAQCLRMNLPKIMLPAVQFA
jgi:preprotein translocase subunit SecB